MSKVVVKPISKEIKMIFTGKSIDLPDEMQALIDEYWRSLLGSGKKYSRGDVFAVKSIEEDLHTLTLSVELTDYAHYLATRNKISGISAFGIMHTAILIETNDEKLAFGRMAPSTSVPGRFQCAGGGITQDDLLPDGKTLDILGNARNELMEEVGLDSDDPEMIRFMKPAYLKAGGEFESLAVVYVAKLKLNTDELLKFFEAHNSKLEANGEDPELSELIFVDKEPETIEELIRLHGSNMDEYMPDLLRIHAGG